MNHIKYPLRGEKLSIIVQTSDHIYHQRSEFQTIDIYESEVFGRILFLDGHIQLTTFDERAYHESLVHVPLLNYPHATKVLVIGGGDGGVLRELVKHPNLQQIDIVEIDALVIEACKLHLPSLSQNAFSDPRVHLHIEDAFAFIKQKRHQYDVIVADSTDTYEGEDGALSEQLFSETFFRDCFEALKSDGMLVTQADNPVFCPYSLTQIRDQFLAIFPQVGSYISLVPSFGGYSAYCYGSKAKLLADQWDFADTIVKLNYLNAATYNLAFSELNFKA